MDSGAELRTVSCGQAGYFGNHGGNGEAILDVAGISSTASVGKIYRKRRCWIQSKLLLFPFAMVIGASLFAGMLVFNGDESGRCGGDNGFDSGIDGRRQTNTDEICDAVEQFLQPLSLKGKMDLAASAITCRCSHSDAVMISVSGGPHNHAPQVIAHMMIPITRNRIGAIPSVSEVRDHRRNLMICNLLTLSEDMDVSMWEDHFFEALRLFFHSPRFRPCGHQETRRFLAVWIKGVNKFNEIGVDFFQVRNRLVSKMRDAKWGEKEFLYWDAIPRTLGYGGDLTAELDGNEMGKVFDVPSEKFKWQQPYYS